MQKQMETTFQVAKELHGNMQYHQGI